MTHTLRERRSSLKARWQHQLNRARSIWAQLSRRQSSRRKAKQVELVNSCVDAYKQAADSGCVLAKHELGMLHLARREVHMAVYWLELAALGVAPCERSMTVLAVLHGDFDHPADKPPLGARHPKASSKACLNYLERAVLMGHHAASPLLAEMWARSGDVDKSSRLWEKCIADNRCARSAYYYGRDLKKRGKHHKAMEVFSKGAELGDPTCQYHAAIETLRIKRGDPSAVAALVDLTYRLHHIPAATWLAGARRDGRYGVHRDEREAFRLFSALHKREPTPRTAYEVGRCMLLGVGTAADASAAVRLYRTAIDGGCVEACSDYGWCLLYGLGVEQNPQLAATHLQRAVDSGDHKAMTNLASMYERGLGVEQSFNNAVTLYRRASDLGCAGAAHRLATLHHDGIGVPRSVRAYVNLLARSAQCNGFMALKELASSQISLVWDEDVLAQRVELSSLAELSDAPWGAAATILRVNLYRTGIRVLADTNNPQRHETARGALHLAASYHSPLDGDQEEMDASEEDQNEAAWNWRRLSVEYVAHHAAVRQGVYEPGTCIVCFDQPVQVCFFNNNDSATCGHACCCLDCARRMGFRCPLCRTPSSKANQFAIVRPPAAGLPTSYQLRRFKLLLKESTRISELVGVSARPRPSGCCYSPECDKPADVLFVSSNRLLCGHVVYCAGCAKEKNNVCPYCCARANAVHLRS